MLALLANLDPLAARTDEVFQRGVELEALTQLIEIGDLQIRAQTYRTAVGRERAGL